MILGLGIPELLIIVVIVMVLFGPKNLPKLGKAVGETVKSVREGMESETKEEAKEPEAEVVEDEESKKAEKPHLTRIDRLTHQQKEHDGHY